MIEMSVDKETVLLSDQSADASLPPQHSGVVSGNYSENVQHPTEPTEKDDGPSNVVEPALIRQCSGSAVAASDTATQSQNGVQQPKPSQPHQQRLNKRRSTMNIGFKSPVFNKRRRRANSESESVLPSNFLMGGNIFDPLNLNSLLDEEVNRALNAETPKSSPLPSKSRDPVEILIPKDITDPLNLNSCVAGDTGILLSPLKSSGGRRRHRNRHHGGAGGVRGGTGRETGSVDCVGGSKGGEGPAVQRNQTESEPVKVCLASQSESTLASFVSGGKEDRSDPKETKEELSGSNVLPNEEVRDERDHVSPFSLHTPVAHTSHRQRKRRRSNSRSENTGASSGEKNKPAVPHSGYGSGQHNHKGQQKSNNQKPNQHQQQKNFSQHRPNQQRKKFQYGNYNQYYGYRNPGACEDVRVRVLRPEWFRGKEVLDLGCNTGHLTLTIAKNWRPSRIVGLDIDGGLIHAAKQNIRHYLSEVHALQSREEKKDGRAKEENKLGNQEVNKPIREDKEESENTQDEEEGKMDEEQPETSSTKRVGDEGEGDGSAGEQMDGDKKTEAKKNPGGSDPADGSCLFPLSFRISRGPIAAPPLPDTQAPPLGDFPSNVTFVKGNYVLDRDALLQTQREEFDVILCLSVTKWVHLNWGDVGLKRFFHRAYRHLRPGGLFILEPQPWSSYSKRKKLTDNICKNYFSIQLKPDQFSSFLTGEVGFSSYELLGTPNSSSRGFQRPIYLFHKGPTPRK